MNDSKKFDEYFRKYYPIIFGTIMKQIRNREQAEDLTMNVFTKCYEKFDEFDERIATFGSWTYRMVKTEVYQYYRHRKVIGKDVDPDECTEFVMGFEDDIIAAEYIHNLRGALADALGELNETQRKIVILKYFKDKSAPEIARIMGMSAVNVRVTLSRAIAKLRSCLEEKNIKWED